MSFDLNEIRNQIIDLRKERDKLEIKLKSIDLTLSMLREYAEKLKHEK